MKVLISAFFVVLSCMYAYCQKGKTELCIVNPDAVLRKYHTIDELNNLGKGELINLYKERFRVLVYLLPYCALSSKPGITLKDLGIPENSENKTLLEKENKTGEEFDKAVNASLDNFIAYADRSNIIWAILFYEDTIRKVSLGKDY
ncbi:MAG: hypothetical protein NZ529_03795 [Cytophagaceae bacterium]|nr:hypothetical protein [Cytophagaceae bacterium]MDW8455894.1 hypothetical protein [Cytophagaceae bacterium]